MKSHVLGIHHVTAISGAAHENYKFYTQTLGQRLVKKTVNFDDPGVYHLYYGDRTGSPGTLMTFFPYGGPSARTGTGQVASSAYPVTDLSAWQTRLQDQGVAPVAVTRFGTPYLEFSDPHGMGLELFESPQGDPHPQRIAGATLKVKKAGPTQAVLELLGFELESQEGERRRFRLPAGGDYLDLIESSDPEATGGAGSVHHIALRVKDDEDQARWLKLLRQHGYSVSPVRDRNYFHSIYFREPGGILFELATDPPGMLIDESEEDLGSSLLLPPQYEPYRARIEAVLDPLDSPYRSEELEGAGPTVVTLHGTGGDEHDLLDLAKQIAPGSPILGLKGDVSEQGMTRFFRRLKEGVFDQADLHRRVDQLASYLEDRVSSPIGVGYSNGANMAAATLMAHPNSFSKLVLFRPMLGWDPSTEKTLEGREVLLLIGKRDRVVPPQAGRELAEAFRGMGAQVTVHELDADHGLVPEDLALAKAWLGVQAVAGR